METLKLHKIISWICETDPLTMEKAYTAEHDTLFLPAPTTISDEILVQKAEEFGFSLMDDCIVVDL